MLWEDGTSPTDYTYTGQRSLSDIGLMDYNARFYDPMLGRFTSPDSIVPDPGSVIGYNRFAYVANNPMIYTDPSGHVNMQGTGGGNSLGIEVEDDNYTDNWWWIRTLQGFNESEPDLPVDYGSVDYTGPGSSVNSYGVWDTGPAEMKVSPTFENGIDAIPIEGNVEHWWRHLLPSHIGWRIQVEACGKFSAGPSGTYGINFVYNFYSKQATINSDYSVSVGPGYGAGVSATTGLLIGHNSSNINDVVSGVSYTFGGTTAAGGAGSFSMSVPANPDGSLHVDPYFNMVPHTMYIGGGGGAGYASLGIGESFTTNNVEEVTEEVHYFWNNYIVENPNYMIGFR